MDSSAVWGFSGVIVGTMLGWFLSHWSSERSHERVRIEELGERLQGLLQWMRENAEEIRLKGVAKSTSELNRIWVLAFYYSHTVHVPWQQFLESLKTYKEGKSELEESLEHLHRMISGCELEFYYRFRLPLWNRSRRRWWRDTRILRQRIG